VGLGLESYGKLCLTLAAFANAILRSPSRLAYTALALVLTMILKKYRLMEVEEPERNGAMQTADRPWLPKEIRAEARANGIHSEIVRPIELRL